jgi:probable F420-dependent oxidoreductase
MKFGVSFMGVSPRNTAEVARIVDQAGFESVWIPEHMFFPAEMPPTYPYSDNGQPPVTPDTPCYDPWVQMGFIACATERVRLANHVFILPLRHPLAVARSLVSVDRLSGGRVTLGAGVGWLADEFEWTGQSFTNRGKRTDEMLEIMRRLFTEDVIEHHGTFYEFGPLKFNPKPLQAGGIPIEVGGASTAALRRAGRLGDGWIEIASTGIDDLRDKISIVQSAREESDRRDLPFEITTSDTRFPTVDDMHRAEELGVTRIVVTPWATIRKLTPEAMTEWAEQFAAEVMTKF